MITAGGGVTLASILNWKRMLPEFTENLDNGSRQTIAIVSGILFVLAGIIGVTQSRKLINQELELDGLSDE